MKIVGLTGSFGTGKTFVASIFRSLGAKVIDADKLAKDSIKKGTAVYREVVKEFGNSILSSDGSIDRKRLAADVFSNDARRAILEKIVHPAVIRSIMDGMAKAKLSDVVVIDAPLLIEAGLGEIVDLMVVVKSSHKKQVERCMKKFGMDKRDVESRIACQIPLNNKILMADFVIDNDGTMSGTRKQTRKVWRQIWK
ncbi:MAG TPA: dephospho-CoA kinase [Candidatus Omnitrophota bacterium]|nr:dephospho-CoA kinase [Candidatus Omnitrophota bacterium]